MKLKLHWQIFIAILLGMLVGFASRQMGFSEFVVDEIAFLGDLFLRALRMIIVPLVLSSIITGVTAIGTGENLGRMGIKTFSYYFLTSLMAILTGLVVVNIMQPGVGAEISLSGTPEGLTASVGGISGILLRIIPQNPFDAMTKGEMLPTIFFALLFGVFITRIKHPYKDHLTNFFEGIFEVMMKMTHFVIKFAPIGIFALMAEMIAETGFSAIIPLGNYMLTVIIALLIHALIGIPALLYFLGKINPVRHFQAMFSALLTAFSTSSSSATLPLTMEEVEERAGVSNKVSSFVLPLGATVNMDGTALYECVAAIFIAQVYGVELSFAQQMTIVVTALLASIGAAGIPMAGLVMMAVILKAVGLPLEAVGLVLAVDRILDMLRTSINVWSDSSGAAIIATTEGETLHVSLGHTEELQED